MKAKFNYKSKRTLIIVAIALVLLIAAIIGTVTFIKGNREAEAAMTSDGENTSIGIDSVENNGSSNTGIDNGNSGEQVVPNIDANNGTINAGDSEDVDNNTNAPTTSTTTGTTNANVPNQEYVQETIIQGEDKLVEQTTDMGWEPIGVSAISAATKLGINKATLENTKLAFINIDENVDLLTATPVDTAAQKGDVITYVIRVKNTSDMDATNIRVLDSVPAGTTLVDNSISDNGINTNGNISWKVKVDAGETTYVSFKVTVTADKVSSIDNTAKVDGQQNENVITHTPIITNSKSAAVVVGETLENRDAKVGETVRYTITLSNTTDYDGVTQVYDNIPTGTTLVQGSITGGGSEENGIITWQNVNAKANSDTTVSFDVTVNKEVLNEETNKMEPVTAIENTAVVGGHNTEGVTTKVANITTIKTSEGSATPLHELDTITYKLTATNNGNGTGTVIISDEAPEGTTLEGKVTLTGDSTKYNEDQLNTGISVTLQPGETKTVTFTVRINAFQDETATTKAIENKVAKQDRNITIPGTSDITYKSYVSVTVNKKWEDNKEQAKKRPDSIRFVLYADGETTESYYDMDVKNGEETHTFSQLAKYDSNGKTINYTVAETEINKGDLKFYTASSNNPTLDADGNKVYEFTNKFTKPSDTQKVIVTKVWDDNNNAIGDRPQTSINIEFKNGNTTIVKELKGTGNTWTDEFELPKYDEDGNVISYTIDEANVPDKYIKSSVVGNTITNSLPRIKVTKEIYSLNKDIISVEEGKKATASVEVGDIVGYKITVTNIGNVKLENIKVEDEMTNGKQIFSGYDATNNTVSNPIEGPITRNLSLEATQSKEYIVYYQVQEDDVKNASEDIENNVMVEAKYKDSNKNEYSIYAETSATVQIKDAPAIEIEKIQSVDGVELSSTDKVEPGTVITYTIFVKNTGNTVQKNVVVTDVMTINGETRKVENIKVNNEDSELSDEGTINISSLKVGETATITATYTVKTDDMAATSQKIQNKVSVVSDSNKTDPTDSTKQIEDIVEVYTEEWITDIEVEKLSEIKKTNKDSVVTDAEYGDTIIYTIRAKNNGKKPGSIQVTDTIPEGTKLKEENNYTNLNADELAKLNTKEGLTKQLYVEGESSTEIYFEVIVTAKAGESIKNTATWTDGTTGGTTVTDNGQNVEMMVNVTHLSEIPKITNSNVVIVLDTSGSMYDEWEWVGPGRFDNDRRINIAKAAVKEFIDSINLSADGKGSAVSVVTFNGPTGSEKVSDTRYTEVLTIDGNKTIATTADDAINLKAAVDAIPDPKDNEGTVISGGLKRAKEQLAKFPTAGENEARKNIVIFVGDGEPSSDEAGDIPQAAADLKGPKGETTVYAIGFGENVRTLRDTVATSSNHYYTTSDDIDLSGVFSEIGSTLAPVVPVGTASRGGKIELINIDTEKDVTIRVKARTATEFTPTTDKVDNFSQIDSETDENGKTIYYLNLGAFNDDDTVEIDYFQIQ